MYKFKNAQENKYGLIDCLILLGSEWVPHTQDPAIEYEISEDLGANDWADIKPCPQAEKNTYQDQQEQDKINQAAKEYLTSSDEFFLRELDTGKPMPEGMKEKRQEARESIKT